MPTHHFESGSFRNELWVAQKRVFPNLERVDVEFTVGGTWDWVIADENGVEVKTVRHNGSLWTGIDLPSLGLFGGHSIGFRNASPGEKVIKQGDVTYG